MIPTPHIEAKKDEIAKTVLMPGDPLRAKFIADNFLENVVQFNSVRGMLGFTGTYNGQRVSIMGSGMGMPSIGIYSYELFKFYDVDSIIRVGSCGTYTNKLNLYDIILATDVWSESTFAKTQGISNDSILPSSKSLNEKLQSSATSLGIPLTCGRIHSSDVFYRQNQDDYKMIYNNFNCIAVEMEAFALISNAKATGKHAACLLTVSDSLVTHEATTSLERQEKFVEMVKIALNSL